MILWRICRASRARTAFDGEGARIHPGRWNHANVPVVYCSSSLSLAALEVLVHVDSDDMPADLVWIRAELPDDVEVERVHAAGLPKDWRSCPAPVQLQDIGSEWAASGRSVVLLVPSAPTPIENNVILNRRHPAMKLLTQSAPGPFVFDPRLRK
ncbi:MAG TPA: RES family NAD+ phosphorylase [Polyangiaceae bacterium]